MLVYTDVFSGDEMMSDSFDVSEEFDGLILACKCKNVVVGGEDIDIGANPSEEDGGGDGVDDAQETVIDVVHAFRMTETGFQKKAFKGYLQAYAKRVKEYLEENDPERVAEFTKGMGAVVKDLLGKFKELQFWMGESFEADAGLGFMFYEEGAMEPTMWLFKHGLKEVKC